MKWIAQVALTALTLLLLVGAASAQDWDKVQIQSQELGEGIWMLYGAGGNHLLVADASGSLLVDADYAEVGEKLLAKVRELAGDGPLQVVETHWHFDHTGGNAFLRESGAQIIAHRNVRARMEEGQHLAVIDHEQPPADPASLPDLVFDETLILHRGEETVEVFHVPAAHTDGDAMVYLRRANILHTGDIVFFCGYPFIDLNAGGNIDGMIAAVQSTIELCDEETQIVPGHGPATDLSGLRQYLGVLVDFRSAVAQAKADGLSLEEVLASEVTAEVDQEWDNKMFPSAAFKELVYRSLSD